ncbi:MAG: SEC61-beta family protein [Candidatus Wukongarchaeota archaeon]|nr:SEC61-beta family protein [Candidatus Wukongarchaeota archaeon]
MRFYEEDSPGIRVGPRTVVLLGVFLIITVILAQLAAAGRGPFG